MGIKILNVCPEARSVELWDLSKSIPYGGDPWVED